MAGWCGRSSEDGEFRRGGCQNQRRPADRPPGRPHEVRAYEVDESDLSAESVARKVGLPPEQVFKTLVARGDKHGVCFAVVPAGTQLDLKALAKLTGDKKIDTVPLKEVQPLTGYIRGGVTVLGAKKAYPAFA